MIRRAKRAMVSRLQRRRFPLFNIPRILSRNERKIFCISIQRTGTTSVGQFFRDHGFRVQGYDRTLSPLWSYYHLVGNYEAIFESDAFQRNQVFEDNPWWGHDFYRFLYHRFPKSRFVLFTRDSDAWFDSMMRHSDGKTPGNTHRHSRFYRREKEYYEKCGGKNAFTLEIDNLLDLSEEHRRHYTDIYELRNREALAFFDHLDRERLFYCELEDAEKWKKLGEYFSIQIENDYDCHKNKSKR